MKPADVLAEFDAKNGKHVILRHMRNADLDRLLRFANRIAKEKKVNRGLGIVSFDRRLTRDDERRFLREVVEGRTTRAVLSVAAFADGAMVGYCDVRRRSSADVRHSGVFGIVIQEGFRHQGLGSRMMEEVLDEARAAGVWLVELTAFAGNAAAISLYEKMGFTLAGTVPNKYQRDGKLHDEVLMFADLRGTDKSPSARRRES